MASASKSLRVLFGALPERAASDDAWSSLWQSFERSLRAGDGSASGNPVSPRTLEIYRDGSHAFLAFLTSRSLASDPAALRKQDVEEFLIHLRDERHAKPATVRARFSALRRFFSWLVEEEELEHSPMERMRGPKVDEPPPEVLTVDEQQRLLKACMGKEFEDRRDMALIGLMLDTGLRRGEVAAIRLEDIDLSAQVIRVLGKGNRQGFVYFGNTSARDLDRYLRVRTRHPLSQRPELWLAPKGALTGDGVHHVVTRRARLAGIGRAIHPHLTRHTWAHTLKAAGASDEDVMTLGRWRDRKVMARYGSSARQDRAREVARRLSPRDRL